MFLKVLLLFGVVLVRVLFIRSEDDIETFPYLEKIQSEMFEKLSSYLQASWNNTAPGRQNVYFYPVSIRIRKNMVLMRLFHETELDIYFPQDSFLQTVYALARIRDRLEKSPNVELKFKIAIFYDPRYVSKKYLSDLKTYYHPETYGISFDQDNEQTLENLIDGWTLVNTKGRVRKNKNFRMTGMDNFHSTIISFNGCWDMPKNFIESIETNLRRRRRRFVPAMPTFMKLHFDIISEIIDVKAFSATERIGYYDNPEKHYEAIRIPFRNGDFAMAVVLPYDNYSAEIFTTFTEADYRYLLRHVNDTYENINYTIPIINSTTFLINEQGASINAGDLCELSSTAEIKDTNKIAFKMFLVNRPFGIFIYHEKTSLVLMFGLVRNPASNIWLPPKFKVIINMFGEDKVVDHYT